MPQISLPVFEGPLDLLLHLIERDDLDITAVSLVAVTDQYLKAINDSQGFNPHALAEFVAIGARLIYLKSRALLPRPPQEGDTQLEDDDVGRELVDLLLEYRRYTEAANVLEERQERGLRVYTRLAPPPERPEGNGLDGVTVDALRKIMLQVLQRTPVERPSGVIQRDTLTLRERIGQFRQRLVMGGRFSFRQAILECKTRVEVVISFMAVLELLKAGECDAQQSTTWGDIEVVALVPIEGQLIAAGA
ncbi:MAG: segregation/condensation protein A [Dehalococcoidia bacterium]|nr:segregation/condensation protein A [Dehalococcoidia bacterium]